MMFPPSDVAFGSSIKSIPKSFAKGLNAILNLHHCASCNVSGIVGYLHQNTSESLIKFVEQTHNFVMSFNLAVEHVWNLTYTCWWKKKSLETSNRRSTGSCKSKHHSCGHAREDVGNETQWTENLSVECRFVEFSRPLH